MFTYKTKKSVIFNEMDNDQRKKYFDINQKSFLFNIDSLYFSVLLDCDWKTDARAIALKNDLISYQVNSLDVEHVVAFKNLKDSEGLEKWLMYGVAASKIYRYDLHQEDKFAMFIAHSVPNASTPQLIVQIRSQFLWLLGDKEATNFAIKEVTELLVEYSIDIKEIKENRIDYAFHTNYIQNPTSYFKSENMNKLQQSRFKRGSIEFYFANQWDTETDYMTLGRKTSNNLFFRIYNKTNEVVNKGYKQFFFELWLQRGLINRFDYYCLELAFLHPSNENHKYLDIARLKFYVEHGVNEDFKNKCLALINAKSVNYEAVVKLANELTPAVTIILNVEFETKRKFYSTLDHVNVTLPVVTACEKHSLKLFRILDNKRLFVNYLTCNTDDESGVIRFINYKAKNKRGVGWVNKRDYPVSDFWSRLQNTSLELESLVDIKLVREYQKNISMELLKKRLLNNVGVFSLYQNQRITDDLYMDVGDLLATINENDLENAKKYKQKRFTQLKTRLQDSDVSLAKGNTIRIVNEETGETFVSQTDDSASQEHDNICVFESVNDFEQTEVEGIHFVIESLLEDLHLERKRLLAGLKRVSKSERNEKMLLERKLDKVNEKIAMYRKM